MESVPVSKDLVLIGGGHSHVAVLKQFGMRPLPGVRLTVICREGHTPYSGMLPGLVAGHYEFDEAHIDLGALCRFAGARFFRSSATGLELDRQRVLCDNRPPVPFDLLSINTGSTPNSEKVPGAEGNVVPVKPINGFLKHWALLRQRVLDHGTRARIAVVGTGAGGVEILLAIRHRLSLETGSADRFEFHLFGSAPEILPSHNARVRRRFMSLLRRRGVRVHAGSPVTEIAPGILSTADGEQLELDEILWVTEAAPPGWPAESGLDVDDRGFIRVNNLLRSTSHPNVFAAGDVASIDGWPRPKSGVFAVRQGKPLAYNLRQALLDKPLREFRPQSRFLSLISTGNKYAVASRGGWSVAGRLVWVWKDWLDRRFMRKYIDLPEMTPSGKSEALPEDGEIGNMRCGGCGAKVAAATLQRVTSSLNPVQRKEVILGLDAPDDAAVVRAPHDRLMVHTVDYFRAMIDDPYIFGRITANHCLGDIFAMGAEPQTALAIAMVPYGVESKTEVVLSDMMAGALEVLGDANCALVGGHTGEGAELGLGFAVNGLVRHDRVLRKAGLEPGDRLLLTGPLGTGTLFAADMRGKARRRWIDAALDHMQRSNRTAADCLLRHEARAVTDVTGFGLVGHLVEMARASGFGVIVDLDEIPVMDGAVETAAGNYLSSLHPQNFRFEEFIANSDEGTGTPNYLLLYDPQTAGGLMAGVPEPHALPCLAALRSGGYPQAAIVGTVTDEFEPAHPVTVRTSRGSVRNLRPTHRTNTWPLPLTDAVERA